MQIPNLFPIRTLCASALAFTLSLLAGGAQTVTYNTNYVVIAGAGSGSQNGTFIYQLVVLSPYSTGCFTNLNGNGATIGTYGGSIILGDYYTASSFPAAWTIAAGSAPAPTGSFLAYTNQWLTGLTNYWQYPGDAVSWSVSGYNQAWPGVSSNQVSLVLGNNTSPFFQTPYASAGGLGWTIAGTLQWDGTNLNCAVDYLSGDTNVPPYSLNLVLTNAVVTNTTFGVILSDPTSLSLVSGIITAGRAPTNDTPQHVYAPVTTTYYLSNAWSLYAITNGMPQYSFWTGNSNGKALVSVWLSNGIPWIKQLQP